MRSRIAVGGSLAVVVTLTGVLLGQAPRDTGTPAARSNAAPRPTGGPGWKAPRTSDGQPDLQGVWDYRTLTPLERPREYAGKEFLSDEEIARLEQLAAERPDGRPPGDTRSAPSVHPVWWLDYGTRVVGTGRSSLVIDPPDGRVPALTADAVKRQDARRTASRGRGPSDGPEDRSLWERCITRGLPEGMLPAGYNNNIRIVQSPGFVVLFMEMIHDARIVALDGRPHLPPNVRQWMGDPRGHWEGETLVVETTNFSDKVVFRGASSNLKLTERFTRIDPETLDYRFTVDDATTWVKPWTVSVPMAKSTEDVYEYACHEGNYGLRNILQNARTEDKTAR
jgi:hypothetical protein